MRRVRTTKQKAICILGMHRSGTSAIARAINLLGAYIGREDQLMLAREDNPDGFWEHMAIYSFHERLLKFLSRSWDSLFPMPDEWWKKPEIKSYREELIGIIEKEFGEQPLWLWKDPRTSLLIPLWKDILRELKIEVCYLHCLRNPLDVAASLKQRNGFSKSKALMQWLLYTTSAYYWTHGAKQIIVHYDHLLEDWEGSLRKVSEAFNLPWPQDDDSLRREMSDFLKLDSRHSHFDFETLLSDPEVPDTVKTFYASLLKAEWEAEFLNSEDFNNSLSNFFLNYSPVPLITHAHTSVEELTLEEVKSLHFHQFDKPCVSIIIPVWNHWKYTYCCLESILKNTDGVAYEVIVVDNGSSDETVEMLGKLENVNIIRNESNQGFALACNEGADKAKGDFVLFLNNDTTVTRGWLKSMVELISSNPTVGAVGAKLIYPDGRLQEAGGMIFSDGRGWNFGNGDDPYHEVYNKVGEVDYCSAACLLVRKTLFTALGGFDVRYAPAYYEEADLCFGLRKIGYQVLYNPEAVIIHHESITAGKDLTSGIRKYLETNRKKFSEKWEKELIDQDEHPSRTGELPRTACRERLTKHTTTPPKARPTPFESAKKKGLIFFPQNPYPAKTGAHRRCLAVLRGLRGLGYEATLFSYKLSGSYPWQEKSIRYLHDEMGVNVMVYEDTPADHQFIHSMNSVSTGVVNWNLFTPPGMIENFRQLFIELRPDITIINYAYWAGLARGDEFNCALKIIDTHDLVTLSTRMWQLAGGYLKDPPFSPQKVDPHLLEEDFYKKSKLEATPDEYQIYDQFDYTIAVSNFETKAIREHTLYTRAVNIPITSPVVDVNNSYGGPPVFVMGDNPFNLQGYLFFAAKILPTVRTRLPDFKANIVGEATQKLLPVDGVRLLGYVSDLKPLYADSLFALCPVMGGTGMPVKVVEAMAHGLPVIAFRNMGQEIPIRHGINGFIADNANEFAGYILQLHSDRALCRKMGKAAKDIIAQDFSERVLEEKLSEITCGRPNRFRPRSVPNIGVSESYISELQSRMRTMEENVGQLATSIRKKDVYIDSLLRAVHEKEQELLTLRESVESMMKEKDRYIENLVQAIESKEQYLNDLTTFVRTKEKDIKRLIDERDAQEERLQRVTSKLDSLENKSIYRLLKKMKCV